MAATKTPAQLKPGTASDTSVVHASQNDDTNFSRKHTERDISRRQSASKSYSETQTYNIGDIVTFENIIYRCIQAVTIPEDFDSLKWKKVIKQLVQFMMNIDFTVTVLAPRYFPVNAGAFQQSGNIPDRASPIPIDIELDQYTVTISSNTSTPEQDRFWTLVIADEIGIFIKNGATVTILGNQTGIFTNTEEKDLVLAGNTIVYEMTATVATPITILGASCRVT